MDIMKLSLCMIAKNEADILPQSLSTITPYVDEMIIVDTGSTDRSKEIAMDFTPKVYDFPWCDDFSAARNFSLEKASCDWVLVLDADEVVSHFDMEQIQSVMKAEYPMVGRIKLINSVTDATGEKRYFERINRLFNRKLFHYEGMIHEQIVRKDGNPYNTVPLEITAEHSGYTQEVLQRTDKIGRNITLLEQALERSPEDTYLLYQLGKSYSMAKNYKAAVTYYKRALTLPLNYSREYVESLVESYGYALINSGRYAEALCLKNYKKHCGRSIDYLFLMGHVYMNNGEFSRAIEQFLACIGKKEGKLEGINSYLPTFNIAVIYECLGRKAEAVAYYNKCGNFPEALKRLKGI